MEKQEIKEITVHNHEIYYELMSKFGYSHEDIRKMSGDAFLVAGIAIRKMNEKYKEYIKSLLE